MPTISSAPAPMRPMQFGVSRLTPQPQRNLSASQYNNGTDVFVPSAVARKAAAQALQFRGRQATETAQKSFLKGAELRKAVEKDPENALIGDGVPAVLLEKTGLNQEEFVEALNHFTAFVQDTYLAHSDNNKEKLKGDAAIQKISQDGTGKGFKALKLDFIGKGNVGWVYRVPLEGHDFVFKIYRCTSGDTAYDEAASGAYFTAKPTSDMSAMYLANPHEKRTFSKEIFPDEKARPCGWSVMEYIDDEATVESRAGETLAQQEYYAKDDHAGNYAGKGKKILIDHGADITKC